MSEPNTAIQFSFASGEIAPNLHNRADWDRRDAAVAEVVNGTIGPTGGASKRPGFRFVNEALHDDKPIRLVEFKFNKNQVYQLEFGDGVMRFYMNGGIVTAANGGEYRIATPFTAAQAQEFRFAQERDTMYFAHWDVALQKLVRHGHTDWRWVMAFQDTSRIAAPSLLEFYDAYSDGHNGFDYAVTSFRTVNGAMQESIGYPTLRSDPSSAKPLIGQQPGNTIQSCILWIKTYRATHGMEPGFPTYPESMDISDIGEDGYPPGGQYLHPKIAYIFHCQNPAVYTAYRYLGGIQTPMTVIKNYRWMLLDYSGNPIKDIAGHEIFFAYMAENGMVYSQFDGQVGAYNVTWLMRNTALDYINNMNISVDGYTKNGIHAAINAFIADFNNKNSVKINNRVKWSAVSGAEGYYVYRRPVNSSDKKFYLIGTTNASTRDFTDVKVTETTVMSQTPIVGQNQFTTPDNYPGVCTFHEQRLLLARTKSKPGSIFASHSGIYDDFSINPSDDSSGYEFMMASLQSNPIEDIPSIKPLLILTGGGDFVSTVSGAMTARNVNFNPQSYNGTSGIPTVVVGDTVIYVPLARQSIGTLTYTLQKDGFADDDILYKAQHLVEGKTIAWLAFQRNPINLIWAVLSDGTLLSCRFIPGQQFQAWTHHTTRGAVVSINSYQGQDGNDQIWAVTRRTLGTGNTRQYIEFLEDMRPYGGEPTAENSFFVDCGLSGVYTTARTSIPGLEHLEGLEVAVLADGDVQAPKTVRNGSITLDRPARVVHVGLQYGFRLVTVDLELFNQGTLRNAPRQGYRATVELHRCRELVYSGSGSKPYPLTIQNGRNIGLAPQPITGDVTLHYRASDTRKTHFVFTSDSPVPCGIGSLVAEIAHADH